MTHIAFEEGLPINAPMLSIFGIWRIEFDNGKNGILVTLKNAQEEYINFVLSSEDEDSLKQLLSALPQPDKKESQ